MHQQDFSGLQVKVSESSTRAVSPENFLGISVKLCDLTLKDKLLSLLRS